jgi:hypothetical protein
VSRPLPGTTDYIESQPILSQLRAGQPIDLGQEQVAQQMAELAGIGVHYVVLHKRRAPSELEANWRAAMSEWQVTEGPDVVVYDTIGDARE